METNVHSSEGPICFTFLLQRFRDMGRLVLFQILKLQYDLLRAGSCFKCCKYGGLQPSPPKFSSIWTSLHLVASSRFFSIGEGGGLSCWKVIKSPAPRSPWDGRGQDFWEAVDSSALLGEMGLCASSWNWHLQQQQKHPGEGPGLVLTALVKRQTDTWAIFSCF